MFPELWIGPREIRERMNVCVAVCMSYICALIPNEFESEPESIFWSSCVIVYSTPDTSDQQCQNDNTTRRLGYRLVLTPGS